MCVCLCVYCVCVCTEDNTSIGSNELYWSIYIEIVNSKVVVALNLVCAEPPDFIKLKIILL